MAEDLKRRVLLFRAPFEGDEESDPYQQIFPSHWSVCSIPVLSFDFVNLDELANALKAVDDHSGIIFTSRRAVEAVQKTIARITEWSDIKTKWREKAAFAVGKTTCRLARNLGFTVHGEDAGNARNLASYILENMQRSAFPLLYPCGNLKRETLPKVLVENDQKLNDIIVYHTSQNPDLEAQVCEYIEKQGLPTSLVYFSPSGVSFTQDILLKHGLRFQDVQVVAIGPSTEEELKKYKIPLYGTALKPTPESLFQVFNQDK